MVENDKNTTKKSSLIRYVFESFSGKKRVFLKTDIKDTECIYVTKKDYLKLYPGNPAQSNEMGTVMPFKFETQYLVFGGLTLVKIMEVEQEGTA